MLNDAPQPPLVNRHAIEMLNRAYSEEAPLAELLKHHRLLALGRAPLCDRVRTMRLLTRAEPTNPAWGEDTLAYEMARMDELRAELRQIRQTNDWPRIQATKAEMESREWQSFLPLDLVDEIGREHDRISRLDAETQMQKYRDMANRATDALDLNRCRGIRSLIERLCAERQIEPGDALMKPLAPFLDWLAEQDRLAKQAKQFDKACFELRDAIAHSNDSDLVAGLYQAVCNYRMTIPKDLESLYRERLQRNKQKQRLTLVFFVVAMLVMLGLMAGTLLLVLIFS
jgi:hypothetical protein